MAVNGAESTGRKRKKISVVAEESLSQTKDLTNGNQSQNQDGIVESQVRVVEEVQNEEEEEELEEEREGEEQGEEIEGEKEEKIEEGWDSGTSNGSQTDVRIEDTEVLFLSFYCGLLHCSSCHDALRPPIYQCKDGHRICSRCCISLSYDCSECSLPSDLFRCLILEYVIESLQTRCENASYGCKTTLSYLDKEAHYKICKYSPYPCPVSPCAFKGCSRSLSHHLQRHHGISAVKFRYGYCFHVALYPTESPFLVLFGPDGRLFLLLNNNDTTRGNALSMICIVSSHHQESNYEYELSVGEKTTLKLKASVGSEYLWKGVYPTDVFLFVPKGFYSSNKICLEVSINKC